MTTATKTIVARNMTFITRQGDREIHYPPGTPVTLPADEADSILERFADQGVTLAAGDEAAEDGKQAAGARKKEQAKS